LHYKVKLKEKYCILAQSRHRLPVKKQVNKIDSCIVRVTEFRYEQNAYLAYCGLFIIKKSSTLSLKTVHRTVFLTLAFKSRHRLLVKEQINKIDSCMVRVTEFRYEQNTYLAYCGLFIIKKSSTLSLKTVHRTVFLTLAFKSRHRLLVK
jgi:hypothetical protein